MPKRSGKPSYERCLSMICGHSKRFHGWTIPVPVTTDCEDCRSAVRRAKKLGQVVAWINDRSDG